MRKLLTIGEVAKLLHLSTSQIRFYEKKGLIQPDTIEENGYRLYSFKEIDRLEWIVTFRQIGFPIAKINKMIQQEESYNLSDLLDQAIEQLSEEIEERKQRLGTLKQLKEEAKAHLNGEPTVQYYPERKVFVLEENNSFEGSEKQTFDYVQEYGLDYRFNNQQFLTILKEEKMWLCIQSSEVSEALTQMPTVTLEEGEYLTWNTVVDSYPNIHQAFEGVKKLCEEKGYPTTEEYIAIENVTTLLSSHKNLHLTVQTRIVTKK